MNKKSTWLLIVILLVFVFATGIEKEGNMAIVELDTDLLTASGNITIPSGCTRIFALVFGSELPPSIAGSVMAKIASVPATTKTVAISIHQFIVSEDNVTVPFVISGTHVTLKYTSGAGQYRDNVLKGTATSGTLAGDLPAATTDLALAILAGMIGPCTIKGDTVAFTYDRNDTFLKTGWLVPGDTTLSGEVKDAGVSEGYTIDGGSIYHPAVLTQEAFYSHDPVNHYVTWLFLTSGTDQWYGPFKIYGKFDNGVDQGDRYKQYTLIDPPPPPSYNYTAYVATYHPAVYTPGYNEELPDTVVPGGEQATVSGIIVLIQTGAALEFVPKIIIGQ